MNPDSNYGETFKDNPSKACFTKSRHKSFKAFHKHALFFPWNYFQYVLRASFEDARQLEDNVVVTTRIEAAIRFLSTVCSTFYTFMASKVLDSWAQR